MGENIDENAFRWFTHVEGMETDIITKGMYVGECTDSRFVVRPWKRWIDTVKNCLKK